MTDEGVFFIVIYVDTLFIVNFFMTFLLLLITSKIAKKSVSTIRFVLASAFGGAYSFIILLDKLPAFILIFSRLISAMIIVLIAFKLYRVKSFAICTGIFFASSLLVLGVVVALYMALKSKYIVINNSTIYFDISATALVLSAVVAYILSCVIVRLHNRILSSRELYTLVLENDDMSVTMLAILDTGNRLREPFSNYPVIVANSTAVKSIVGNSNIRYIPVSSVNNHTLIPAFKPSRVVVKTPKSSEVIENVYIAMSSDMQNNGFSAILNPEILSI